jgi:hypothetical protein
MFVDIIKDLGSWRLPSGYKYSDMNSVSFFISGSDLHSGISGAKSPWFSEDPLPQKHKTWLTHKIFQKKSTIPYRRPNRRSAQALSNTDNSSSTLTWVYRFHIYYSKNIINLDFIFSYDTSEISLSYFTLKRRQLCLHILFWYIKTACRNCDYWRIRSDTMFEMESER